MEWYSVNEGVISDEIFSQHKAPPGKSLLMNAMKNEGSSESAKNVCEKYIEEVKTRIPLNVWNEAVQEVIDSGNQSLCIMCLVAIEKLAEYKEENSMLCEHIERLERMEF